MPPATSVFVGGGTPSLVQPADWSPCSTRCPVRRAARSPSSATPTRSRPSWPPRRRPASTGSASGCSRWSTHVLAPSGAPTTRQRRRAVDPVREAAVPTFNLDLIYGGAGETVDDWTRTLDARPRPRTAPRQRLRPDRRARHAAGRRPRPPPRRRRPGREVPGGRRAARGGRAALVRDLELGAPGHECRHNELYWSMGEYQAFGCAGHCTGAAGGSGTCGRPSATSTRSAPAVARGRRRAARSGRAAARGAQLAIRTRAAGCPPAALPVDDGRGDLVAIEGDRAVPHRAWPAAGQRGGAAPGLRPVGAPLFWRRFAQRVRNFPPP